MSGAPRACMVDWRAFDLRPAPGTCERPATKLVRQECPCGHVTQSPACWVHAEEMRGYGPDYHCAACLDAHPCEAPLTIVPLDGAS